MYQRPTAPLSIGGVLDDGFRLLKASFGKVIGLSLVGAFAGSLPNFLLGDVSPENAGNVPGLLGVGMLVAIPVSLIIFVAMISRICAVAAGREDSVGDALGVGLRRFLPVLGWAILYSLAFLAGTLLFIIPGIILFLSLAFGAYLIVDEGIGPVAALKRSHNLVWGNWWRTAVLLTIILFVLAAAYILLATVAGAGVLVEGPEGGASLTANIVTTLLTAVINPVTYCFSIAILNDLRLRKQGGDLAQRIGELEAA